MKLSEQSYLAAKASYQSQSPLEQIGIFDTDVILTDNERKALGFINRLNNDQLATTILYIDDLEKKIGELKYDSRLQRDYDRLKEQGIDAASLDSLASFHLMCAQVFGDEHRDMRNYALTRVARQVLYEPNVLELSDTSKNNVETSVRQVENYLTSWFKAVEKILPTFMPLEMEIDGVEIKIEEGKGSNSYNLNYQLKKRIKDSELPFLTPYDSRRDSKYIEYVKCRVDYEVRGHKLSIEERIKPNASNNSIDCKTENLLLNIGTFVQLMPKPDWNFKIKEQSYEFDFTPGIWESLMTYISGAEKMFYAKAQKEFEQLAERGWIEKDDLIRVVNKLCPFILDKGHRIKERFQAYTSWTPNDDSFHVCKVEKIGPYKFRMDTETIKAKPELKQPVSRFVFRKFRPEEYDIKEWKSFWDTLRAYAKLPERVTAHIEEALRVNYHELPQILLEDTAANTKQSMEQIKNILTQEQIEGGEMLSLHESLCETKD